MMSGAHGRSLDFVRGDFLVRDSVAGERLHSHLGNALTDDANKLGRKA